MKTVTLPTNTRRNFYFALAFAYGIACANANLILIGDTGCGRSTLANTIASPTPSQTPYFTVGHDAWGSVTRGHTCKLIEGPSTDVKVCDTEGCNSFFAEPDANPEVNNASDNDSGGNDNAHTATSTVDAQDPHGENRSTGGDQNASATPSVNDIVTSPIEAILDAIKDADDVVTAFVHVVGPSRLSDGMHDLYKFLPAVTRPVNPTTGTPAQPNLIVHIPKVAPNNCRKRVEQMKKDNLWTTHLQHFNVYYTCDHFAPDMRSASGESCEWGEIQCLDRVAVRQYYLDMMQSLTPVKMQLTPQYKQLVRGNDLHSRLREYKDNNCAEVLATAATRLDELAAAASVTCGDESQCTCTKMHDDCAAACKTTGDTSVCDSKKKVHDGDDCRETDCYQECTGWETERFLGISLGRECVQWRTKCRTVCDVPRYTTKHYQPCLDKVADAEAKCFADCTQILSECHTRCEDQTNECLKARESAIQEHSTHAQTVAVCNAAVLGPSTGAKSNDTYVTETVIVNAEATVDTPIADASVVAGGGGSMQGAQGSPGRAAATDGVVYSHDEL
eukprot:GFYU01004079.1.p1 GENE.GFYU01004079.1~~GFYU01004079.1.p1  ORF type:complete len:595 (+),score=106.87 GFYU01004079.1:103-1785(+)